MKSQTTKIFELCHTGKWVCQTTFWENFIRYPSNRRQELVDQLNRAEQLKEKPKYKWYWDIPKDCDCNKVHTGCKKHRLLKKKI